MSILTAKAFRQQIMNPAEGLFLFHPRAIERLILGEWADELAGASIPHLPYYLMPRAAFLFGLETENAEALSVIEGLRLPNQVILLPSPPEQRLESASLTRLQHQYWGRSFEAEVARAWQTAREDNHDQAAFGPAALTAMIGEQAFVEVREVLARDRRTLPVWDDTLICRAFVAAVVRLRYFATGARGFFFPAIQVWPAIDRWLSASGLDLPTPRQNRRLPMLLVKSRPGSSGELPPLPLLPLGLPYGGCDPDLAALAAPPPPPTWRETAAGHQPATHPNVEPDADAVAARDTKPALGTRRAAALAHRRSRAGSDLPGDCLRALARGSRVRRRGGWAQRLAAAGHAVWVRILGWFLIPTAPFMPATGDRSRAAADAPATDQQAENTATPPGSASGTAVAVPDAGNAGTTGDHDAARQPGRRARFRGLRRRVGLALFEQAIARAQRAEFSGRCAVSLRALADARRVLGGLLDLLSDSQLERAQPGLTALERALAEREAACTQQLTDLLAAKWKLPPAAATDLETLILGLANTDRAGYGSLSARLLLANLEQVLLEQRADYYRMRPAYALGSLIKIGAEQALDTLLTAWGRPPQRRAHRHHGRLRQVLPFHGLLRSLRALATARVRLEELPWSLASLEQATAVLDGLTRRVADRLEAQLTPRLQQAMNEADFVPRDHRERVAAHKMKRELLDVIKQRRHLKFTDVRDIVARNILRLPDPTLDEFFRGDRLRRFDATAERALPGVYRPGEIYIKGLQQLGAPLFGTDPGRSILRHVLLPFGGAYVVVKSLDMLLTLVPGADLDLKLTNALSILVLGSLANLFLYSGIGRHLAIAVWTTGWQLTRFLLWDGPRGLLRWGPVAALLGTGLMRGLGRNLIQPLLIGSLPLVPIIALAVFVEEVPIEPGLWLLGLAFALGTLARNTPAGRRFLDDLATNIARTLRRINQTLVIGLIQQLLYFFKEVTRRFAQFLHRVEETLTPRLGERWYSLVIKAVLAPVWRLIEAVIQFYVTVLVEPQVNPIKHFPIVSIGHKIMLPFLPAITVWFLEISAAVLPKVIAYPLVTLTIILLPGLFGFLVWELKENYKLYQANHRGAFNVAGQNQDALKVIEPAVVGSHGETMRGLMTRGFHSGALPKAFDRLRRVIRDQQRDDRPYPKRLRRCQRQLEEVRHAVCVFIDREFTYALRERCEERDCTLARVETNTPRLATNSVEMQVALYPRISLNRPPATPVGATAPTPPNTPILIDIHLRFAAGRIRLDTELVGDTERIGPHCWELVCADLRLFAGRAGARAQDPRFA